MKWQAFVTGVLAAALVWLVVLVATLAMHWLFDRGDTSEFDLAPAQSFTNEEADYINRLIAADCRARGGVMLTTVGQRQVLSPDDCQSFGVGR